MPERTTSPLVSGTEVMSWGRTTRWTVVLFVLLATIFVATCETSPRVSVDVANTLVPAHHLVQEGTLDVSELRGFLAERGPALLQYVEVSDGLYPTRTPGSLAVAALAYRAAAVFGVTELSFAAPSLVAALLAAAAIALLFPLFVRLVDPRSAAVATLVAGLATSTWTVSANALWPHAPTQLAIVVAMLMFTTRRRLAAGLAFGVGLLIRPPAAAASAAMGLWAWRREGSLGALLKVALGTVVGLVLYFAYVRVVLGTWSPLGGYEATGLPGATGANPFAFLEAAVFTLVHPRHGIAPYSPFVIVLLLGLREGWRVAPEWVRASALGGLAYLVAQIVANGYDAGDFYYGYRYQLEPLTFAAPLLLVAWRERIRPDRGRRIILAVAIGVSVLLHAHAAIFEVLR